MMRSLWSGVSGLKTHQLEMDVIGNNIANVNTTAYKSQATGFSDILYQTVRHGTGGGDNVATVNASQVGLGAKVGSIYNNITTQGSMQTTGNVLDLMITGDSFFVVEKNGINNFTRDGSFTIDAQGFLVTQNNGFYVHGVQGGNVTNAAPDRLQVINRRPVDWDGNGTVDANENLDYMDGQATSRAYFKGNIDILDTFLKEGRTVRIDVFGNDGKNYTLKFDLKQNEEDTNKFDLTLSGVINDEGKNVNFGEDQTITLEYDKHTGKLASDATHTYTFSNDASAVGPLTIDFTNTTNYAGNMSHSSTVSGYKGDLQGLNQGYARGSLTGVSFGTDGSVFGIYSNGQTVKKGQIAVAEFNNASGLELIGDNLYAESLNSGAAQYLDITSDGGYMSSGVLEASNVNLAKEFTDMITTQRGFQANSRVITTSDEMLQLLKQLKR